MFVLVMGRYIHIVHVFCALQSHCPFYDSAWLIYEIWRGFFTTVTQVTFKWLSANIVSAIWLQETVPFFWDILKFVHYFCCVSIYIKEEPKMR